MALRAKGLSLPLGPAMQANSILAETGEPIKQGLFAAGANVRNLFDNQREERRRSEDKAERADDKEYQRARADRLEGKADQHYEDNERQQRDTAAAAWLKEQHAGAVTQLRDILMQGRGGEMEGNAAYESARGAAAARERDLAGKLAEVHTRLTGMRREQVETPAPVFATFDTAAGAVEVDTTTPEGRVVGLQANLAQIQERRKRAKSEGEAALWAGREGAALGHLELAKAEIERGAKATEQAGVDAKKAEQWKANVKDMQPVAQRAKAARVPDDIIASILGSVASGQARPMVAMRALEAEMKKVAAADPEAVGDIARTKAVAQEEAQASAARVTGQETDAEKSQREIRQKQEATEAGKKEAERKYDREAVERFEKEMDRTEEDRLGRKTALPARLDRLSLDDAKRVLRMENVSPAVKKLAEERVASEPKSAKVEKWERGPDGKLRKVGG